MAMRELDARTSDMVIIGGVDNSNGPFGFLSFARPTRCLQLARATPSMRKPMASRSVKVS